ncbi:hypothetical protein ACFQL0_06825 [Haloplanus litoreus]|uniref:hypothetical protein n=1 Tax=Haloplanus litoreus TaxID=767515 RepID=UPI003617FDFF
MASDSWWFRFRRPHAALGVTLTVCVALSIGVGRAVAHSGGLRGATRDPVAVPTWLFLLTGGGVVGVSFLLASFVTDRRFVAAVHDWLRPLPTPGRVLHALASVGGVGVLATTLVVGVVEGASGVRNLAVLVVWVAWWGGYVASTYLLGNTWPALNPFRTVSERLLPRSAVSGPPGSLAECRRPAPPRVGRDYHAARGRCGPPHVGPRRLHRRDARRHRRLRFRPVVRERRPLSRAFRLYGRVAPLGVEDGSLRLRLPGSALPETSLGGRDDVAFVVTLLFVTTYDGFVATGPWAAGVSAAVGAGVPPVVAYLGAYLAGAALFYLAYHAAARLGRRRADTYLSTTELARRFAPSLLPIAAGYHLAHNLGSVLVLGPTFAAVAAAPLSPPPSPPQLAGLPAWFGGLELAFVLLGHLVAVWVAHAIAYDLFPSRLQAVRSQYGVTAVMVGYTMLSLWIVAEPYVAPPSSPRDRDPIRPRHARPARRDRLRLRAVRPAVRPRTTSGAPPWTRPSGGPVAGGARGVRDGA